LFPQSTPEPLPLECFSYKEIVEVCPLPHPDHGDQFTAELGDPVAKARSYAVGHGHRCVIGKKTRFPLGREVAQNEFRRRFPDQSRNPPCITDLRYSNFNRRHTWKGTQLGRTDSTLL